MMALAAPRVWHGRLAVTDHGQDGRATSLGGAGEQRQLRDRVSSLVTCHSSLFLRREIHAAQEGLKARVAKESLAEVLHQHQVTA